MYVCMYVCKEIMENNPTMRREILKNKEIHGEEFNIKESRPYNVSVSINHDQE